MNPEELARLLRNARKARDMGIPDAQIDAYLKPKGVESFAALRRMAAAQEAKKNKPYSVADAIRGGLQGLSLDHLDEILGADDFISGAKTKQAIRGDDSATAASHPGKDALAHIAGSLPLAAATAPLFPGAATAGPIARLGAAAAIGGATGAVQGHGMANEENVLPSMARGLGIGAATGLGAGAVAEVATRALPAVGQGLWSMTAPEAAGVASGERAVTDAARRGGLSKAEFLATMGGLEANRPGLPVPADASAGLRRTLRASINDASGGIEEVLAGTAARAEGGAERLAADARRLTGVGDVSTSTAKLGAQQTLRRVAKEVYGPLEQKYGSQIKPVPGLDAVVENVDAAPYWAKVKPAGGKKAPGFIHYQRFVQELEDAIEGAKRAGAGNQMRRLIEQKDLLKESMEGSFPGYLQANTSYNHALTVTQAPTAGGKAYSQAMGAEAVQAELDALMKRAGPLAEDARKAYRIGMVNKMIEGLLAKAGSTNAGRAFTAPAGTLTGRANAIRVVFPTEESFTTFVNAAKAEGAFSKTLAAISGNSTTAPQKMDVMRLLKGDISGLLPEIRGPAFRRSQANTISGLLAGRSTGRVAGLIPEGGGAGMDATIGAGGLAPAGQTMWDYVNRGP